MVHGCPGLAMACNRYAIAEVAPSTKERIEIELPDLQIAHACTVKEAEHRFEALHARHATFLDGSVGIEDVLTDPCDLPLAAWLTVLREAAKPTLPARLRITATIPPHAGLGSSAATLVAALHAAAAALRHSMPLDRLADMATRLENLRHGRSSGLDPTLCAYGGTLRFQKHAEPVRLDGGIGDLWLVQTGSPASSTGECVDHVGRHFGGDPIWDDFSETTAQMEAAWCGGDSESFRAAMHRNHRLLVHIGVVPPAIAQFIETAEALGLAGKICGAGAIRGNTAGILLLHGPEEQVASLCSAQGYAMMPCVMEPRGVHDAAPQPREGTACQSPNG